MIAHYELQGNVLRGIDAWSRVWEAVDFWAGVPWPVSRADAQRMAVDRLGWAIEVEDGLGFLVNPAFTPPGVTMSGIDTVSFVRFRIADVVTEETPATRAFLGDLFTPAVREGAARLGRPSIRRDRGRTDTTWEMGPAPVTITLSSWSVVVRFHAQTEGFCRRLRERLMREL
ncbi:hypothetical protein F4560_002945 [Saccharothrix ecbatanensis]|uniref:Uncharacterized protein n=1 Tax=Saccharothrix ecbatanensis TaxID=1105145 RepID=A0A7W9HIZ8_9PSEU|nr:DUF6301 family protein [Saccharothrix ecbatanensis]MBB5803177.1 hypothetical protein [Saccharothrix ecbatanensis]